MEENINTFLKHIYAGLPIEIKNFVDEVEKILTSSVQTSTTKTTSATITNTLPKCTIKLCCIFKSFIHTGTAIYLIRKIKNSTLSFCSALSFPNAFLLGHLFGVMGLVVNQPLLPSIPSSPTSSTSSTSKNSETVIEVTKLLLPASCLLLFPWIAKKYTSEPFSNILFLGPGFLSLYFGLQSHSTLISRVNKTRAQNEQESYLTGLFQEFYQNPEFSKALREHSLIKLLQHLSVIYQIIKYFIPIQLAAYLGLPRFHQAEFVSDLGFIWIVLSTYVLTMQRNLFAKSMMGAIRTLVFR